MRADSCRAHAQKCRAQAVLIKHQPLRNRFFDLAQTWESMAHQIEELEALGARLEAELEQPNAQPQAAPPPPEERRT